MIASNIYPEVAAKVAHRRHVFASVIDQIEVAVSNDERVFLIAAETMILR